MLNLRIDCTMYVFNQQIQPDCISTDNEKFSLFESWPCTSNVKSEILSESTGNEKTLDE